MGAPSVAEEVERYLQTGDTDFLCGAWPGSVLEAGRRAREELRGALVAEVRRRMRGKRAPKVPEVDPVALARQKVAPMVRGLFAKAEQGPVLAALEKSVVFVTGERIEALLREAAFDHSAWTLANLYLTDAGAPLLSDEAERIVGLSEGLTCFVSAGYFEEAPDSFADFIVHESAHVFHNCKRVTLGLRATRNREWLLEISFGRRETFAYACEAYSRVLERGASVAARKALASQFANSGFSIPEERIDPVEVADIVCEAAAARNGWKRILARCAGGAS